MQFQHWDTRVRAFRRRSRGSESNEIGAKGLESDRPQLLRVSKGLAAIDRVMATVG